MERSIVDYLISDLENLIDRLESNDAEVIDIGHETMVSASGKRERISLLLNWTEPCKERGAKDELVYQYAVNQCDCGSVDFWKEDDAIRCGECGTVPPELPPPPHPDEEIRLDVHTERNGDWDKFTITIPATRQRDADDGGNEED